eukprot:15309032-Alexandrium_andersonii.AAC.1
MSNPARGPKSRSRETAGRAHPERGTVFSRARTLRTLRYPKIRAQGRRPIGRAGTAALSGCFFGAELMFTRHRSDRLGVPTHEYRKRQTGFRCSKLERFSSRKDLGVGSKLHLIRPRP